MDHTGNGSGNGHEQAASTAGSRFVEDSEGATLDSGLAICRFDAAQGGRLRRWQWRTTPPPDALNPATRGNPPRLLDLVDVRYGALIDHFLPLGTKPQEFAAGEHREFGDFVDGAFKSQVVDSGGEIRIGLLRDGEIKAGKRVAEVRMAKSAALRPTAADISGLYRIINSSMRPMQILFALEYNLYAPGLAENPSAAGEGFYLIDGERPPDASFAESGVSPNATSVTLGNPVGEMALQLGWDRQCDLWRMPAPDGGPGVRLLAVWRVQLPPRDNWALGLWMAPA
jgi:Domain of unknown function (DUF1926)